jgi:hypothetical protein
VGGVSSEVLCYYGCYCSSNFVVVILISNIGLRMRPHPHSYVPFFIWNKFFCTHLFPSFFMKVKIFREIISLNFHTKIVVGSRNVIWRVM